MQKKGAKKGGVDVKIWNWEDQTAWGMIGRASAWKTGYRTVGKGVSPALLPVDITVPPFWLLSGEIKVPGLVSKCINKNHTNLCQKPSGSSDARGIFER